MSPIIVDTGVQPQLDETHCPLLLGQCLLSLRALIVPDRPKPPPPTWRSGPQDRHVAADGAAAPSVLARQPLSSCNAHTGTTAWTPPLFDQPIVMLDFETTGLSAAGGDRITEVAALRIIDDVVVDRYVTLINCGVRIPSFVTALTGISQRMVDSAPPVAQVLPQLLAFIGNDVLAAHNASFDNNFLLAESQRQGLTPGHRGLICSLKLARRMLPGQRSYKLGGLAHALNISYRGNAHRAEADAEVSTRLLLHIGDSLRQQFRCQSIAPSLLEAINRQSAAKVPAFLSRSFEVGS